MDEYVDQNVLKWVESIWSTYDKDGDDKLNKYEARCFCDDHMEGKIDQSNFPEMWDLMDRDKSGDLDRNELARMITWFKIRGILHSQNAQLVTSTRKLLISLRTII